MTTMIKSTARKGKKAARTGTMPTARKAAKPAAPTGIPVSVVAECIPPAPHVAEVPAVAEKAAFEDRFVAVALDTAGLGGQGIRHKPETARVTVDNNAAEGVAHVAADIWRGVPAAKAVTDSIRRVRLAVESSTFGWIGGTRLVPVDRFAAFNAAVIEAQSGLRESVAAFTGDAWGSSLELAKKNLADLAPDTPIPSPEKIRAKVRAVIEVLPVGKAAGRIGPELMDAMSVATASALARVKEEAAQEAVGAVRHLAGAFSGTRKPHKGAFGKVRAVADKVAGYFPEVADALGAAVQAAQAAEVHADPDAAGHGAAKESLTAAADALEAAMMGF